MTSDASLPPNAPMTDQHTQNGTLTPDNSTSVHGEADASSYSYPPNPRSLREVCADVHSRVEAFLACKPDNETLRRTQEQTKISLGVIEKALQDYDFNELSLSYNGGKDCLVLLILYLSVLHTHFTSPHGRRKPPETDPSTNTTTVDDSSSSTTFPTSIPSIYAKPPDPFPLVTSFVAYSTAHYHLDLTHISTNPGPHASTKQSSSPRQQYQQQHSLNPPAPTSAQQQQQPESQTNPSEEQEIVSFRDAFALYLHTHPSIRAIFVGTRRTDPHGAHLTFFDHTDGNWPPFMRVHPVIDWRLSEVWAFLRHPCLRKQSGGEELQYCRMYDLGYTSLGGVGDTVRNPRLRYVEKDDKAGKEVEKYRPAYEMVEDEEERLGRE